MRGAVGGGLQQLARASRSMYLESMCILIRNLLYDMAILNENFFSHAAPVNPVSQQLVDAASQIDGFQRQTDQRWPDALVRARS